LGITRLNVYTGPVSFWLVCGGAYEGANGVAVDNAGSAYVTGFTLSMDFPLMNTIQGAFAGGRNHAFIYKIIGRALPAVTLLIIPDAVSVSRGSTLGYTVTATNTTARGLCFQYWEDVTLPNCATYPPT